MTTNNVKPSSTLQAYMDNDPMVKSFVEHKLIPHPELLQRLNMLLDQELTEEEMLNELHYFMHEVLKETSEVTVTEASDEIKKGGILIVEGAVTLDYYRTYFSIGLSPKVGFEIMVHLPDTDSLTQNIREVLPVLCDDAIEAGELTKYLDYAQKDVASYQAPLEVKATTVEETLAHHWNLNSDILSLAPDTPVVLFVYQRPVTSDPDTVH